MNLFGLNISISHAGTVAAQKALSVPPEAWVAGEDLDAGGAILSNAYQQVVWVYRAVNALAEQVANIPFRFSVGEAGGEQLITEGPLHDLYARPHPQINRFQYWELRVIWLMLRGECFRVPIYSDSPSIQQSTHPSIRSHSALRTPHSALKSVLILDPAHFHHIVEANQLIGWRYTGFGPRTPLAAQVFLPEEVWFEKLPNPFDFWRGLPPLYVAALAAETDFAAGAFMKGLIENNGDVGVIVRTQESLNAEQREQIVAELKKRKRRAGAPDQPLLLGKGAEVLKPTLSSTDLQFLENRKFSRAEICAAFGVPEEIVATTDVTKYDVMTGARLNFIENRIVPLCRRLEAEEDALVKTLDPRAVGWFDVESLPILQQARRERLRSARTGFEMGIPFNELNRVFDLGFKPLPWGDAGYVPASLAKVSEEETGVRGQETEGRGSCPPAGGTCQVSSQNAKVGRQESESGSGNSIARLLKVLESGWAEAGPSGRNTDWEMPEFLKPGLDELAGKLRRYFFEQRARVLSALARRTGISSGKTGSPTPTEDPAPGGAPAAWFNLAEENKFLAERLKPASISLLELCVAQAGQAPGVEVGSLPPRARDQFWAEREEELRQVNQGTLEMLTAALGQGDLPAAAPEQLAARVRAIYNHAANRRADCLARVHAQAALKAAWAVTQTALSAVSPTAQSASR